MLLWKIKISRNDIILLCTIDEIFPILMIDDMYKLMIEKN